MLKTVEKMLAVPNRLQKANGWSYSSRLWNPRQLGCDYLSNSCRPVVLKSVLETAFGFGSRFWGPHSAALRPSAVFQ